MSAPPQQQKSEWRDTRHVATPCPFCGHKLDAASSPDGSSPSPGDLAVCISCASPLVFEEGLTLRAVTAAEWQNLDAKERAELRRFQQAVRSIDRREMADGEQQKRGSGSGSGAG